MRETEIVAILMCHDVLPTLSLPLGTPYGGDVTVVDILRERWMPDQTWPIVVRTGAHKGTRSENSFLPVKDRLAADELITKWMVSVDKDKLLNPNELRRDGLPWIFLQPIVHGVKRLDAEIVTTVPFEVADRLRNCIRVQAISKGDFRFGARWVYEPRCRLLIPRAIVIRDPLSTWVAGVGEDSPCRRMVGTSLPIQKLFESRDCGIDLSGNQQFTPRPEILGECDEEN